METRITIRMKPHTFHPFDLTAIIGFMTYRRVAYNTNEIHEGATVLLFCIFTNKATTAVLKSCPRTEQTNKKHIQLASGETKCFNTYSQLVNFLSKTYATEVSFRKQNSKSSALRNVQG